MPKKLSYDIVVQKANIAHNFIYKYPIFDYINRLGKMPIICQKHGLFYQNISDHLYNKAGCPHCKSESLKKQKTKSIEFFIEKANLVHDFFYDYSKAKENYIDSRHKVVIVCPIHGEFLQAFYNHVNAKAGCPKCNSSKGELQIEKWLKEKHIEFVSQKKFKECKGIKNLLPFDFFIPKFNLCIEYDGEQHYRPVCFNGMKFQEAQKLFEKLKINDEIKNQFCQNNSIELLRIPYFGDIITTLKANLTNQGL